MADGAPEPSAMTEAEGAPPAEALAELAIGNSTTEEETLEPPPDGISIDFNIKHPLQRSWTMWYDNPGDTFSSTSKIHDM